MLARYGKDDRSNSIILKSRPEDARRSALYAVRKPR